MTIAGSRVELQRYHIFMPLEGLEGDMEYAALYAGQSCALVHRIEPAARIVAELAKDARAVLQSKLS
jgi:NAD(P)H-dependent flavin oxidoreductase YrpB (nitropropane dioxygenase family)